MYFGTFCILRPFPLFLNCYINLLICIFVDKFLSCEKIMLAHFVFYSIFEFDSILRCDRNKKVRAETNQKEGGTLCVTLLDLSPTKFIGGGYSLKSLAHRLSTLKV